MATTTDSAARAAAARHILRARTISTGKSGADSLYAAAGLAAAACAMCVRQGYDDARVHAEAHSLIEDRLLRALLVWRARHQARMASLAVAS